MTSIHLLILSFPNTKRRLLIQSWITSICKVTYGEWIVREVGHLLPSTTASKLKFNSFLKTLAFCN